MIGIAKWGDRRSLESYWDLLVLLVQKELKVRYKKNVLGYVWSIANPLAFAFVYFFAFKVVMRIQAEAYPLVLLSGLFPWQWYANTITTSPNYFISTSAIIRKVSFPLSTIPLAATLNNMLHFLFSVPVLLLMLFFYHRIPTVHWIYGLLLLVVIQTTTLYGISLMLSALNLFLRDIERVAQIVAQFAFFFTPIVYTVDLIPERYRVFLPLNPAAPLMVSWRDLILKGQFDWMYVLISAGYALIFLGLGYWVFRKLSYRFAEVA